MPAKELQFSKEDKEMLIAQASNSKPHYFLIYI